MFLYVKYSKYCKYSHIDDRDADIQDADDVSIMHFEFIVN